MQDVRVVLIGGTSHTGKSTAARTVAQRLGFDCRSTDLLARHPGRPWRTPEWVPPPHVAEHYATLDVDELIRSVLDHYARLWPRIEELIADRATGDGSGLVLEGSALWPARVARLTAPQARAVWLTADDTALRERMRASACYDQLADQERYLVDRFLARTERYQELMTQAVDRHGLARIDTAGRSAAEVADLVLAAVDARAA
ncbi:AAA family ATPase [Streptomyces sp. DT2A-34]|uniref:AAA family ATPase n=1 Tax=Streptomyces sp. DT2A-34 TaxID=3051182 RepID=UPI00265C423B|nr:AAA family ATPase [Streptomyces sp. DT2A-34]MDO0917703.1 AAA family ATPase [Streptomyces sp. DT2A-34]